MTAESISGLVERLRARANYHDEGGNTAYGDADSDLDLDVADALDRRGRVIEELEAKIARLESAPAPVSPMEGEQACARQRCESCDAHLLDAWAYCPCCGWLRGAGEAPEAAAVSPSGEAEPILAIDDMWQELCEKDDRTSPPEHPDMCLISFNEFRSYLEMAAHCPKCASALVITHPSPGTTALEEAVKPERQRYLELAREYVDDCDGIPDTSDCTIPIGYLRAALAQAGGR